VELQVCGVIMVMGRVNTTCKKKKMVKYKMYKKGKNDIKD
jgi:hypothetical protein